MKKTEQVDYSTVIFDIIESIPELETKEDVYLYLEDLIQEFIYRISESYDHQGPKEEIPEFKKFLDVIEKRRNEEFYY